MTTIESPPAGNPEWSSAPPFSVKVHLEETRATVMVVGELDCLTAPDFGVAIDLAITSSPNVFVNMSDVSFMDSSGLGALIRGYKSAEDTDGSFVVHEASPAVRRLLELTGQTKRFMAQ